MKVLMVLTSHDCSPATQGARPASAGGDGRGPYHVIKDARRPGHHPGIAKAAGARHSIPRAMSRTSRPTSPVGSRRDTGRRSPASIFGTVRLDSVKQEDYDTVFYPGGHGPMWDLVDDKNSIGLLESFLAAGKTFAVVCHSSGALRHVKTPDGKLLIERKTVTGFTDGRECEGRIDEGGALPGRGRAECPSVPRFGRLKNRGVRCRWRPASWMPAGPAASSGPAARASWSIR